MQDGGAVTKVAKGHLGRIMSDYSCCPTCIIGARYHTRTRTSDILDIWLKIVMRLQKKAILVCFCGYSCASKA